MIEYTHDGFGLVSQSRSESLKRKR